MFTTFAGAIELVRSSSVRFQSRFDAVDLVRKHRVLRKCRFFLKKAQFLLFAFNRTPINNFRIVSILTFAFIFNSSSKSNLTSKALLATWLLPLHRHRKEFYSYLFVLSASRISRSLRHASSADGNFKSKTFVDYNGNFISRRFYSRIMHVCLGITKENHILTILLQNRRKCQCRVLY